MIKVMIDPGHGGSDPGAKQDLPNVDYDGLMEKTFNLATSLYLELMLANNDYDVNITRHTDKKVTLKRRIELTDQHQAECFISIHADSWFDPAVDGFTVFYNPDGKLLARFIQQTLAGSFPNLRDRGAKPERFYVLRHNNRPAVLVECGFISNDKQRLWLLRPGIQYRIALSIFQGINLFFNRG